VDSRQVAEHLRFFQELGVTGISRDPSWSRRENEPSSTPNLQLPTPNTKGTNAVALLTLHEIREDLGDCTRCKLHTLGRKQIVFGVGNPNADLMFVGEAPGADEDAQGIPFVGRAGQLLTKMIEAMGFRRDEVYIANVIKCRPPQNRNPEPDEVEQCEPFLFKQIESIKPNVIVALGSFAAKALLKTTDPISRLRGRVYEYHGAKLVPTFHPSFLLRSPDQKKYAWDDLKKGLTLLDRQPPRQSNSPA
jgi:uracil-DNA glycosylase family 4